MFRPHAARPEAAGDTGAAPLVRAPGLMALLVGGFIAVLLLGGSLVHQKQQATDRTHAEGAARQLAEFELQRLEQALRVAPDVPRLRGRLADATPTPARVAVAVWDIRGQLVVQSLRGARHPPDLPPSGAPAGIRIQQDCACIQQWRSSADGRHRLGVLVEVDSFVEQARAHSRRDVWLFFALLLVCAAVPLALLWPQIRALSALAVRVRQGRPAPPWPARPPRWMAREVRTLFGALRDAQAQADAEEQRVAEARELMALSSEADPDLVLVCDAAGRLRMANRAAQALLGTDRDALVGMPLLDLFAPPDQPALELLLAGIAMGSQRPGVRTPRLVEMVGRHGRIPVRLTVAVGAFRGAAVVWLHGHDLRPEREATARLEQALASAQDINRAKSRFVASVSHEIRTPLNGLAGMLDLLRGTQLDPEQREFAEVARSSARQLRSMVDDLLDLSKVEAGKLEFESIPFDVQEHLGNTVRTYQAAAAERGVQLQLLWRTPHRMLLGDPYRICQVLNNLVDNAIKFTERGSVQIEIATRAIDGDEDHCELIGRVIDTGIGIPPDRVDAIFDHFAQAEQSTTRRYGGTGLGLSLCRELCRQMGGDVQHAARPGGGSVFRFTLRCALAHGMSAFQDTRPNEDRVGELLHGRRVLVVDDNRVNQTLLDRWLQREGVEVVAVGDGESAVREVARGGFDAVLMDVTMPVMNGLDATRAIRALSVAGQPGRRRFADLPIIGISAHAMDDERDALLACGMNDYVTKPIKREALLEKLAAALAVQDASRSEADDRVPIAI